MARRPDICARTFCIPLNILTLKMRNNFFSPNLLRCSSNANRRTYGNHSTCHTCIHHQYLQYPTPVKPQITTDNCHLQLQPHATSQEIEQLLLGNQLQQNLKALMRCSPQSTSSNHLGGLPTIGTNLSLSSSSSFVYGRNYLPILEMRSFPHFLECSQLGQSATLKVSESSPVDNQAQLQHDCEDSEDNEKENKELNLKILAEELCIELPLLLESSKKWHNFSRYTPDIQLNVTLFKANKKLVNGHTLPTVRTFNGLKTYKAVLHMYRWWNRTYLNSSCLEVVSMHPDVAQSLIEIRWRIVGFSPSDLISTAVLRMSTGPTYYDFVSYFHVNDDGLIWRHDVENVQRFTDQSKQRSWKTKLTDMISIKSGVGV